MPVIIADGLPGAVGAAGGGGASGGGWGGARRLRHRAEVVIATDAHLHATVAEPGEVVLQLGETVVAEARRHGDLESRAVAGAERILRDRLRGVGRQPSRAMDLSARTRGENAGWLTDRKSTR